MKILVNLIGLSDHDVGNGKHDFEKCYESLFNNLITPIKKDGNKVDFFLKTYETPKEERIKNIYKPIKSDFTPIQSAFDSYIESINNLKLLDYDFYIITRFDLWLGETIKLDYSKFNFLFKEKDWWDSYKGTTDTFYAFPKEMLDGFIIACIDFKDKNGQPGYVGLFHALHLDLQNYINPNEYNFIDEEKQTIQISKKYTLSRYI